MQKRILSHLDFFFPCMNESFPFPWAISPVDRSLLLWPSGPMVCAHYNLNAMISTHLKTHGHHKAFFPQWQLWMKYSHHWPSRSRHGTAVTLTICLQFSCEQVHPAGPLYTSPALLTHPDPTWLLRCWPTAGGVGLWVGRGMELGTVSRKWTERWEAINYSQHPGQGVGCNPVVDTCLARARSWVQCPQSWVGAGRWWWPGAGTKSHTGLTPVALASGIFLHLKKSVQAQIDRRTSHLLATPLVSPPVPELRGAWHLSSSVVTHPSTSHTMALISHK